MVAFARKSGDLEAQFAMLLLSYLNAKTMLQFASDADVPAVEQEIERRRSELRAAMEIPDGQFAVITLARRDLIV